MIRMYATLTLIALAACGSDDGTKYDYSKCGEPSAFVIANADIEDGAGALALPKGIETDIALKLHDAEGDLCDPSGLELAFDDPTQVEVVSQGEDIVLKATRDAIDDGDEPVTGMHATLGSVSASWTVSSVVALGGTWNVVVTEETRYPEGFDFGDVIFTQRGRRMTWEDCTISLVCSRDALIQGHDFTVDAPDVGVTIAAPISHDRRSFSGPWSTADGDYKGTFSAERVD